MRADIQRKRRKKIQLWGMIYKVGILDDKLEESVKGKYFADMYILYR